MSFTWPSFLTRTWQSLRPVVAAGVSLAACGAAWGQYASQGIDLLKQFPLSSFGSASSGNDCWGYVAPSGREYALISLSNQLAFVEVTDPVNAVIRTTVSHSDSLWGDVKVYQRYCYVVNESGGGMQVIDMNNIDAGSVTLVRSVTSNGLNTSHNVALNPDSGYVYPVGSSVAGSNGGLVAYSLATPSNPVFAGMWNQHYVHDAQVVSYTSGPYAGKEIAFCCIEEAGLAVVDVTNKLAMTTMATRTYPGVTYCHQGWLSPDRRYFYIDDELDAGSTTRIFDVQDLSNPVLVGTFSGGASSSTDHNLYTNGRYIYEANYHSGLRVFDAITPTAPVEVAWFDTYPANNASGFDGAWSTYPYFPSGTIIISDIDRGLFVVRLNLDFLVFSYPAGQPSQVMPDTATPLTVQVVPSSGGTAVDPLSVVLHARVDNGAFDTIPMSPIGGNQYRANLPATPCLSTVSYYVTASNTSGDPFSDPSGAPATLYSAPSYASRVVSLSYNMETTAGWARDTIGDTAITGLWERGNPEGTAAQPEDDHTSGAGVNCWVTGRLSGGSVGGNDIDGGKTTLLSPTMNLLGANPDTRIGYWRWYSNTQGSAPNADTMKIDISNNNGASWVSVEVVGPVADADGGWIYHEFRVADEVALTATMRMRFIADDLGSGSVVEAALDDFEVFYYDCGVACPSVTQHPADDQAVEGESASFTVAATGGGTLTYQWRKGTTPLSNGGNISGATGTTLTINPVAVGDAGDYNAVVTNSCGSATSNSATLTVYCKADYNQDGFVDGIDYDMFNNDFEAGNMAADYNGDGFVDGIDYDEFNNDFEAGC